MDILAVASVQAGGAAFDYNKGCASVSNFGVGQNDVVLDNPADEEECIITGSVLSKNNDQMTLEHISDTVKRVNTFDSAGAPSDAVAFTFLLIR